MAILKEINNGKTILYCLFLLFINSTALAQNNTKISWAANIGTGNIHTIKTIRLDSIGDIYVAGIFEGTSDFDGTGKYVLTSHGLKDIFFAKYDSIGNLIWAKNVGGKLDDIVNDIQLDKKRNIYLTGNSADSADFNPDPGQKNMLNFGAYFVKYNNTGDLVWAKQIEGPKNSYGTNICLDDSENIYLSGYYTNNCDFDPGPGNYFLSTVDVCCFDIFFAKYSNDGNFTWAKRIGGTLSDFCYNMKIDDLGNLYISGNFTDSADFDPGPSENKLFAYNNSDDAFFAKYDNNGNLVWAKQLSGLQTNIIYELEMDKEKNVYITGRMDDTVDFDPSQSIFNLSSKGSADIFFAKYGSSGNFLWAKNIGGYNPDISYSMDLDTANNIYITGEFYEKVDFDPGIDTFYLSTSGTDSFFAKYDSLGNFIWSKKIDTEGSNHDRGSSIYVDNKNIIYLAGTFDDFNYNGDFDPGPGTYYLPSHGNGDGFIARYDPCWTLYNKFSTTICDREEYILGTQILSDSGEYIETFKAFGGCDSIVTLNLTVISIDTSITIENDSLISNSQSSTYQWYDCSEKKIISNATDQYYKPQFSSSYAVIISNNGCLDTSSCYTIILSSTDNLNSSNLLINIGPNPVINTINTFLYDNYGFEISAEVRDNMGNILASKILRHNKDSIDVSHLKKGVYFLFIERNKEIYPVKIIKID